MKARAFSAILTSFIMGIFLAPFFNIEVSVLKILILGILVLAIVFFRKNFWFLTVLLTFGVFLFAILRYSTFNLKDREIEKFIGKEVEIIGVIDSEPEAEKVTRFIIDTKSINETKAKGKILVTTRNYPKYKFGEKVKIFGGLKAPPSFEKFSYKNYLARFGVYSVIDFPTIEKTKSQYVERDFSEALWHRGRTELNSLRKLFERGIENILPEPHASFMNGLILGSKKSIPDWLMENFKKTGTSHIVALSGFNITIIVYVLRNITRNLSRRLSFWVPILGIFLFVILTGAAASVVRAAIMGSMLLLAKRFGRQGTAFIAVAVSAAVMLYLNPLILRFDIGFQLSFMAVLGLIYITPLIENYFVAFPKIISENLSLTLAAQLMALPILVLNFGQISLISPLANVLILPLIPLAMFSGFIAAVMGIIFLPLGKLLGYVSFVTLDYMIRIIGLLSKVDFANILYETNNLLLIAAYYLILIDIFLLLKIRDKKYRTQKS